jgi:myo-inositol-1(or 4)-monophosphatase
MSIERRFAINTIKKAGVILREGFKVTSYKVSRKEDSSLVTDIDYQSNEIITSAIKQTFPNHAILSEESSNALTQSIGNEPTWVIDPLDGTSNFVAHIPLFGIALAFVKEHKPILGVIYDPLHNDLFVTETGKGSTLNEQPIYVSQKSEAKRAMLFAGRGYRDRDQERHGKIIYALEKQTTYFRRLGSAAIMLSSVASGRADSVILTGNKPWDVVAGALLIREAGGRVTDYCGNEWNLKSEDMVATNGYIHDEIIRITREQEVSC